MSNYHDEIMNLRASEAEIADDLPAAILAYKTGHRDARHAAAEIAAQADARIDELREAVVHRNSENAWIVQEKGKLQALRVCR